jgi:uncharacterized UPF0146 family protein
VGAKRSAVVRSLSDALARYDRLAEVGVGDRTDLAAALAADHDVVVVDVDPPDPPPGVRAVRDDVVARARAVGRADPAPGPYADRDALYARRLPPELQRPALTVARAVGAPLWFTTLGTDPAVVETRVETVREGTLHRAGSSGDEWKRT